MINIDGNKGMERGINEITYISRLENKIKNLKNLLNEKWKEEFKAYLYFNEPVGYVGITNSSKDLAKLLKKYLGIKLYQFPEVKIKAKKGKIVIERIK